MNIKETEKECFVILSLRSVDKWVSRDIVNTYEDAFAKMSSTLIIQNVEKSFNVVRRAFKNHYIRSNKLSDGIFRVIQKALCRKISCSVFMICVSAPGIDFFRFYRTNALKIIYVIDIWENQIKYIANRIGEADIFLVAYQDSIDLLREYVSYNSMKKVYLFPVFVDPTVYLQMEPKKAYDIIQVGRKNDVLHKWAIQYSNEKHASYLYQKKNKKGIYYFNDRRWDGINYQLSYKSLIDVLSRSKIALISPPNLTNYKRTGNVSPLTPRYLEAAMCYAVPVGFAPTSGEYANYFPKMFTLVPQNYEDFKNICDRLIGNDTLRKTITSANRAYIMTNHTVSVRYKQLQQILQIVFKNRM